MSEKNGLSLLAQLLINGNVEVVDLTAVLGPETPLIKLPPELAVDTPPIEIHRSPTTTRTGRGGRGTG